MNKKSVGKNSVYSMIKSCSTIIFPLITFPYVSRVLQPVNVGKINFTNSIVSYFAMIATLGVTTYAVRECTKVKESKEKLDKVASQIYSINILSMVLAYLLLGTIVLIVPDLSSYKMLIMIASSSILLTTIGADWINTAMEDFKYITIRTVVFQILSLVLMFVFVRKPEDYIKYMIITVISSSGANILNLFYRKKYCNIKFRLDLELKKHLPPILHLFAMTLAQQVFTTSDTTMIGFFYGDYEVGIYSTALKIYNIVNQLMASITWVVMPQLAVSFSNENYQDVKRILKYSLHFISVLGIPCMIGIYILSPEIIILIGGEAYLEAVPVLRILVITLGLTLISNYVLNINILASGKDKVGAIACIVPAIFNLITNAIFIPQFGIEAAAWTTALSQLIIIFICLPHLDKRCETIKIIKQMWRPWVAGIGLVVICIIVCIFISDVIMRVILCMAIGGLEYILVLLILKDEFIQNIISVFYKKFKK